MLTDVLDVKNGLSHAVFDRRARGDLPFWLGLMRSALVEGADLEVRQRVRYEVAVAMIRGIRDLRVADFGGPQLYGGGRARWGQLGRGEPSRGRPSWK